MLHSATLDWITPNAEQVIARHARVSTKDPDRSEYAKLLSYCIAHAHWSVFEQAAASFEILTTRAVSPQILRHRSCSFQELSQRYASPSDVLTTEGRPPHEFSLRRQADKNRQSSVEELDAGSQTLFRARILMVHQDIQTLYQDMLDAGVARECARNILPEYTPTRLHMQASIRSFLHYVGLRGQDDTQLEHRMIAQSIGRLLAEQLPVVVEAIHQAEDKSLAGWAFLNKSC
jgi:thymidylate synthase (FAD)